MADINIAYLEMRLSGGAGNTDQNASLGGVMSSSIVFSKSVAGIVNLTGVTLLDAPGSLDGNGLLEYTNATNGIKWTPNGGVVGSEQIITTDGRYVVFDSTGAQAICFDVVGASLPAVDASDSITVSQLVNQTFDDWLKTESYSGADEYRAFYYHNAHPTDSFVGSKLFIPAQPSGADTIEVGIDPAGVGDGVSTGVGLIIANEKTAPVGVIFSAPGSSSVGLPIDSLSPGQAQCFWQHRNVPPETLTGTIADTSIVALNAFF